jgi:predicted metalloprotease with PDZ domain
MRWPLPLRQLPLALLGALLAVALLAACGAPGSAHDRASDQAPRYEALLQPQVGEDGDVTAIRVESIVYGGLQEGVDRFTLTAPIVYAGAYGIADRVQDLEVSDRRGRVPLAHEDDPVNPGGFPFFRRWQAQRDVVFPVRASWRTLVEQPTDRRGPPFNIRPSAGGVSGAGSGFLVIPLGVASNRSQVRWDLGAFGPGAAGISSFGEGPFEVDGSPAALWQGWFMTGPVGRYPAAGDVEGFSAAWLGDFPFDPQQAMREAGEAYAWLGDFFGYLDPPPRYRVFMRLIDSNQPRFSGTALGASFMLSGGPQAGTETNGEAPRGTFLHEMVHMWVGGVEGPQGVTSWFSEGLTSYYTLVLPLRAGFGTVEDYGANINRIAERYYTSPALGLSAADIAAVGFGSEEIRRTPYDRGVMYFADLDARLRERSGGAPGLDPLVRRVFERRHGDEAWFDHDAWVTAVTEALGADAAAEFQSRIIEGEPIAPVSDAFGPCFERRLTRYEANGKTVPGYEWVRVADVPDDQCVPQVRNAPEMAIDLKPLPGDDDRTIAWLEVIEVLSGVSVDAGATLLELAAVTFNVPGMIDAIELLDARDPAGVLTLSARDAGEGDAARREWFAERTTAGPVTVRYRVPAQTATALRGPAPPTELRNDAGAVSGSGASFLLRPPAGAYRFRVTWNLTALPDGARAVSSLGYAPSAALPVHTLDSVYFMAGRLGHFPAAVDERSFYSAWQGAPPFDAAGLMATARTLREDFIAFFAAAPGGYGVMLRPNPVNAGGGIGLHRSFVLTFDDDTDPTDLAFTLSHEMFHTFQPRLDAGSGHNGALENAWFNEGLAVFYQREFLLRAGLVDLATYLEDLNTHAGRFYTNVLGDTPNSEIAAGFWRDTRIRTLPYDRGFLYFATVDEAVREASGNARSLDDLVREMRRLQDQGQVVAPADWVRMVRRELGDAGPVALQHMLAGGAPLPGSGAFGPCFRRTTRELRRYELGFEPAVLTEDPRIVRGLVEGSAAQRAGLRDGDRILRPVPQDAIQADQHAQLELQVQRGESMMDLVYLPRGETVTAWQWERIEGVPDAQCPNR